MGITFAVRGDNLDARTSYSGKTPGIFSATPSNGPQVVSGSLPGLIGTGYIDAYRSSVSARALLYNGVHNMSANRATSILMRACFNDVNSLQGVWQTGGPWFSITPSQMYMFFVANSLHIALYDEHAVNLLDNYNIGSFTPVAGRFYDILLTSTGDTTANGLKVYVDGVLIGSTTLPSAIQYPRDSNLISHISLGGALWDVNSSSMYINEFVVWDDVIDPSSVTLETGTGTLNGESRTSFVSSPEFDGLNSSDPGVTNVLAGISYHINGETFTGTRETLTVVNEFKNATLTVSKSVNKSTLTFSQGDSVVLKLKAINDDDAPVDLTSAVLTSRVLAEDGTPVNFGNAKHSIAADQDANKGEFTLTLDPSDTVLVGLGSGKEIVTKVVQGPTTMHFHGSGLLNIRSNVPSK